MTRDRQRDSTAGARTGRSGQHRGGANSQEEYARQRQPGGTNRGSHRGTAPGDRRHAPGRQQATRAGVPLGLRLVAVTMGTVGGLLAVAAWLLFTGGSDLSGGFGNALQIVGLVAGVLGGGHLLAAYGLWTITPWGRRLALLLAVGTLLLSLLTLLNGGSAGVLGVLLYGGTSWYLYTSEQQYRHLRRGGLEAPKPS